MYGRLGEIKARFAKIPKNKAIGGAVGENIWPCGKGIQYGSSQAIDDIAWLIERVETLARMDREAATYCEGPICMRTHFTGEDPYIGWKGLGKAMEEAFDERDRLREQTKPDGGA